MSSTSDSDEDVNPDRHAKKLKEMVVKEVNRYTKVAKENTNIDETKEVINTGNGSYQTFVK